MSNTTGTALSDRARLWFSVEGSGSETVLLLMGLGGHATEWGRTFPRAIAERFRVIRMDNRGIAASEASGPSWTMEDMARDACAVLDAAGVRRAHVVGTSMGGMIAQVLATEHADRVERLVLIASTCGGLDPEPAALPLFGRMGGVSVDEFWRRSLRLLTAEGFIGRHRDEFEEFVRRREETSTRPWVFKAQLEAIRGSDRSALVTRIRKPTLILHGRSDLLVPVRNAEVLARLIPGARLVLLAGCGHLVYLEEPEMSASEVLQFLSAPM